MSFVRGERAGRITPEEPAEPAPSAHPLARKIPNALQANPRHPHPHPHETTPRHLTTYTFHQVQESINSLLGWRRFRRLSSLPSLHRPFPRGKFSRRWQVPPGEASSPAGGPAIKAPIKDHPTRSGIRP